MASLPSLLIYLDSLLTLSESISTNYTLPVTSSLYTTLTALNTPSSSSSSSSSSRPAPLKPLLLATALADSSESRKRLLKSSEQQDAHELWGMIRDAIEEESIKLFKIVQFEQLQQQENQAGVGSGLKEVLELSKNGFRKGIEGIGENGKGKGKGKMREQRKRRKNDPWFWLRSQRIKCMNCGYVRDTRHEGEELLMLNVPPVVSSKTIFFFLSETELFMWFR